MPRVSPPSIAAVLSIVLLGLGLLAPVAYAQAEHPNIILIVTDDQQVHDVQQAVMPTVDSELIRQGVLFTNSFVVTPLCVPGRAALLTGQYPHNNGIWRNHSPNGGYDDFVAHESETLAVWLNDAGYETALIGKYLNGYGDNTNCVAQDEAALAPPEGWDNWVAFYGNVEYYNYCLDRNDLPNHDPNHPVLEPHGEGNAHYSTNVLGQAAVDFINNATSAQTPFFLMFTPKAPHEPSTPADMYANKWSAQYYHPDNFREPHATAAHPGGIMDKPQWFQDLLAVPDYDVGIMHADDIYRNRLRTLLSVDDWIHEIIVALGSERAANTIFVFTSDNGFSVGEHGWISKVLPYEEDIRVPLVIRYDQAPPAMAYTVDRPVLNIDIARTVLDLADIDEPFGYTFDGESLKPFIDDPEADPTWRTYFMVESLHDGMDEGPPPQSVPRPEVFVPTYCAVRRVAAGGQSGDYDEIFMRYRVCTDSATENWQQEFYPLESDPFQLVNKVDAPPYAPRVVPLSDLWHILCGDIPVDYPVFCPYPDLNR